MIEVNPFAASITMFRGESVTIRGTAYDPDAAGTDPPEDDLTARIDLTDGTIHFCAARNLADSAAVIAIDSDDPSAIEILDQDVPAEVGVFDIRLVPDDTAGLAPGSYDFEIRLVDADSAVKTLAAGKLIIRKQVAGVP